MQINQIQALYIYKNGLLRHFPSVMWPCQFENLKLNRRIQAIFDAIKSDAGFSHLRKWSASQFLTMALPAITKEGDSIEIRTDGIV